MSSIIINFLKNNLNWNINLLSLIEPIGGLSNTNYKAIYNSNVYFIRLCTPTLFKVNRENELDILNKASSLSLCNPPIYFNIETGNMVYKWIDGEMPTEFDLNSKEFLDNLCNSIKKLHLSKSTTYFNPFNEIRERLDLCITLKLPLPSYIYSLTEKLSQIEKGLESNKLMGLCHNDLNISNIILSKTKLFIIDYEFSATCDVFFDLATISWLQSYNGRINLLKSYFRVFNINDYNKLLKYIYVVKLLNALWSLIKSSNSTSDYDYEKGANIIFQELYSDLF